MPLSEVVAQSNRTNFRHIGIEHGLSDLNIKAIVQDSTGFIWVGTGKGLCRYDGIRVKVYETNIKDNSSSIPGNEIRRLLVDEQGVLWIATNNGLCAYHAQGDSFTVYRHRPQDPSSIANDAIYDLLLASDGFLYLTTWKGVSRLNRQTGQAKSFTLPKTQPGRFAGVPLQIEEDAAGYFWLGTWNSKLYQLDKNMKIVRDWSRLIYNEQAAQHPSTPVFRDMMVDSQGFVWLALWYQNHVICLNPESEKPTKYQVPAVGISRGVNCLTERNKHEIIAGTENGILRILTQQDSVIHIPYDERYPNGLSDFAIHTIFQDSQDGLWIGTNHNGISYYHPRMERSQRYQHDPFNERSMPSSYIRSMTEFPTGYLWIKTLKGDRFLDLHKKTFLLPEELDLKELTDTMPLHKLKLLNLSKEYKLADFNDNLYLLSQADGKMQLIESFDQTIHALLPYSENEVLLLLDNGNTLLKYNVFNKERQPVRLADTLQREFYRSSNFYKTSDGQYWATFHQHILNFSIDDPNSYQIQKVYTKDREATLAHSEISHFFEDSRQQLWMTSNHELILYDRQRNEVLKRFTDADGLPPPPYHSIIEDQQGYLWVFGRQKISRLNPHTFQASTLNELGIVAIKSYDKHNILTSTGDIYFSSNQALLGFNPDAIKPDSSQVPLLITSFYLLNKHVQANKDGILTQAIYKCKQLVLKHDQNTFSFDFAALDYINPAAIQYRYKLEGYDRNWLYTNAQNSRAAYTQIPPGKYRFVLQASNSDGVWNNQEVSLEIIVKPPWWKSLAAKTVYIIVVIALLLIARYMLIRRMTYQRKVALNQLQQQANIQLLKKEHELEQEKIRFFMNISHDLLTPLTLILGPIKRLIDLPESQHIKQDLNLMQRNARRLQRLINQILDVRLLESGKLRLQVSRGNVLHFVDEIYGSFKTLALQNLIDYKLEIKPLEPQGLATLREAAWFDNDKLEKVLFNLLSNAFKYTPEGGNIHLSVNFDNSFLVISIFNSGTAISKEALPHLFDRFYRAKDSDNAQKASGTGIGLSHTKDLLQLHHGTIQVNTKEGIGNEFVVRIPILKKHYTPEEQTDRPTSYHPASNPLVLSKTNPKSENQQKENQANTHYIVLIVDDNPDILTFIRSNLDKNYLVLEARNGQSGLAMALQHIPDIIISDIMMPKVDGIEMSKKIKTDQRTSHIPLILLTARTTEAHQLEGYQTGADDYITKPFSINTLIAKIDNLMQTRVHFQQHISKQLGTSTELTTNNPMDKRYIEKLVRIVQENLQDPHFGIKQLCEAAAMSKSQLYRKLQALTGQTAAEFIRTIRLNQASKLIRQTDYSFAEVATMVGFNDPSYFGACFKKQFGQTATAYRNNS